MSISKNEILEGIANAFDHGLKGPAPEEIIQAYHSARAYITETNPEHEEKWQAACLEASMLVNAKWTDRQTVLRDFKSRLENESVYIPEFLQNGIF